MEVENSTPAAVAAAVELIARDSVSIRESALLLESVVRRTRVALDCDMAYLSLNDADAGTTTICASNGVRSDAYARISMPLGTGVLGLAATGVGTESADYLPDVGALHIEDIDSIVRDEGVRAILAVPLRIAGLAVGALTVANRRPGAFTSGQRDGLTAISSIAAVCVEIGQLRDVLVQERRDHATAIQKGEDGARSARESADLALELASVLVEGGGGSEVLEAASQRVGVRLAVADAGGVREGGRVFPFGRGSDSAVVSIAAGDDERLTRLGPVAARFLRIVERYERAIEDLQTQQDSQLLDDLIDPSPEPALIDDPPVLRLPGNGAFELCLVDSSSRSQLRQRSTAIRHSIGSRSMVVLRRGRLVVVARAADDVSSRLVELLRGIEFVGVRTGFEREEQMPWAFVDVRRAVGVARSLGRLAQIPRIAELGVAVFAAGTDRRTMDRYIDAHIAPLRAATARAAELRETALRFVESQGSIAAVSDQLGIHANTVRQRVERIDELLGPSWRSGPRSLDVHLALRINESLPSPEGRV